MSETDEHTLKATDAKPERSEQIEQIARGLLGDADEQTAATEIAMAFLRDMDASTHTQTIGDVETEIDTLVEQQRFADIKERLELYTELIQKGRTAYEERLTRLSEQTDLNPEDRAVQERQLHDTYVDSIVLEKIMKMRAITELLNSLLDPYLTKMDPYMQQAYQFSPEFETSTTYVGEKQKWVSRWDPDVHYKRGSKQFFSPHSVQAIRAGLETYFTMRDRVLEIKITLEKARGKEIQRNDTKAAEMAVRELLGNSALSLEGEAEILFDPLAVTVILHNKADYNRVHGQGGAYENSGGVHMSRQFLNLVKGETGPLSAYIRADITQIMAHENEHALNEILQHGFSHEERRGQIMKKYSDPLEQSKSDGTLTIDEFDRHYTECLKAMLPEYIGHQSIRFADEVLAYRIADGKSAEDILYTLTKKPLYEHLQIDQVDVQNDFAKITWNDFYNLYINAKGLNGLSLNDWKKYVVPLLPTSLVAEQIDMVRREIIAAVIDMENMGYEQNEIRALFSGENPAHWRRIADGLRRVGRNAKQVRAVKVPFYDTDTKKAEWKAQRKKHAVKKQLHMISDQVSTEAARHEFQSTDEAVSDET